MSVGRLDLVLVLGVTIALAPALRAEGQEVSENEKTDIYENPEIFSQLSGAKRSLLERQYGRRPSHVAPYTGAGLTSRPA